MPSWTLLAGRVALGVLVAVATFAFTSRGFAQAMSETMLKGRKITIGFANQSPWGLKGEDGEATGFHPDLVRAAFKPLGVEKIELVIAEFGALIPALAAKRVDIVASGLAINPQRCKQVIFSEPDLAVGDGVLVAKGNPFKIHSYADVVANPQIRMGGGRGSSNTQNALDAGIPASQMTLFQDVGASVSALTAKRVDAVTMSIGSLIAVMQSPNLKDVERAMPFKPFIKPNGQPALNYAALAFRPADTELRDLYNKRLAEMRNDGTLTRIMEKYGFSPTDEMAPQTVTAAELCRG
jgi:polar amino acid transport system substrate-binding protein